MPHASHCCIIHGCKYMEKDCPVVLGKVKQDFLCESCRDFSDANIHYLCRTIKILEYIICDGIIFSFTKGDSGIIIGPNIYNRMPSVYDKNIMPNEINVGYIASLLNSGYTPFPIDKAMEGICY